MFSAQILMILFFVLLEGVLSMDNALALAAMVRPLEKKQRQKALTYGIWGAIVFRIGTLFFLTSIIQNQWIRLGGAVYLLFIAMNHFFGGGDDPKQEGAKALSRGLRFWETVILVELTDLAFSADSIIASVSFAQALWVTATGGVIGIFMMRLASLWFAKIMDVFPRLEDAAYLLITICGLRLFIESGLHIEIPNLAFQLIFLSALGYGFSKRRKGLERSLFTSKP